MAFSLLPGYRLSVSKALCNSMTVMSDGLSRREQTVLSWLRQGLSNKEIALALSISTRTVQKHLERVYRHLGVQTRVEAIVLMQSSSRKARASRS